MVFDDDRRRNVQKEVTWNSFYGSLKKLYRAVLAPGGKHRDKCDIINNSKKFLVWFAKVFGAVRVESKKLKNGICKLHNKKSFIEWAHDPDKELCFVQ